MVRSNASSLPRDDSPLDEDERKRPPILGECPDRISSPVRLSRWAEFGKRGFGDDGSRRHNGKRKFVQSSLDESLTRAMPLLGGPHNYG